MSDYRQPGSAVRGNKLPSGVSDPEGIAFGDGIFVVVDYSDGEVWSFDDITLPGDAVLQATLPSGAKPTGVTWDGSRFVIADDQNDSLWSLPAKAMATSYVGWASTSFAGGPYGTMGEDTLAGGYVRRRHRPRPRLRDALRLQPADRLLRGRKFYQQGGPWTKSWCG